MNHKGFFKEFWDIVSYKDTSQVAVKQDIILKTITCIILAFVSGTLTLLNINKHFSFMTITTIILTVGMLVSAVLCAKFKRTDIASVLVAILGIVIFTDYAASGANEGFAILWITIVPLICMLWMGVRLGFLVSLYFQILLVVLFYTGFRESMSAHYTDIFMTRFPLLYMGTFLVSSWIFYQKQKNQMNSDNFGRKDPLTQIDNRLGFNLKIDSLFGDGEIFDLHIIVFDINRLKYINDEFGHKAGDEIIMSATDIISTVFPSHTIFARVGGDEFYMVVINEKLDFEGKKKQLNEMTKNWKGSVAPFLSISCGYAHADVATKDMFESLLQLADRKMYADKSEYYKENLIDRRRS